MNFKNKLPRDVHLFVPLILLLWSFWTQVGILFHLEEQPLLDQPTWASTFCTQGTHFWTPRGGGSSLFSWVHWVSFELSTQVISWSVLSSRPINHDYLDWSVKGGPGASGRVLPPVTGRSRVRVAVSSHCTGEGKACHGHPSPDPAQSGSSLHWVRPLLGLIGPMTLIMSTNSICLTSFHVVWLIVA